MDQIFTLPPDPGWQTPWVNGATGTSWWYPVCIMMGFAVAIILACLKMWKLYKISTEPFYWFILIGVPCAILGARFGSCAIGQTPWNQFFVNFGQGLAIEWGVMLTVLAAFIYFPLILKLPKYRVKDEFGPKPAVRKVSMWMYFDAIIPAILIAQFIGRWGNYCNQEVYGMEVTSEGLANFLNKVLPGMYIDGAWRQPLFFWEGIGNLAMFFVLYVGCEFIKQKKAGDLAGAYFVWYGAFRAGLEPLRDNNFGFKTSFILSIVWAVIGVLFILINHLVIAKLRSKKELRLLQCFGPGEALRAVKESWYPTRIEMAQLSKARKESKGKDLTKINKKLARLEAEYKHAQNKVNPSMDALNKKLKKFNKQRDILLAKQKDVKDIDQEIKTLQETYTPEMQKRDEARYAQCKRTENEMIYFGKW